MIDEQREGGRLESVRIDGDRFLGRWFDDWLPYESERYGHLYDWSLKKRWADVTGIRSVFQGIRQDVYEAGFAADPFSQPLLGKETRDKYRRLGDSSASVFPDGTAMAFRFRF